MKIRLRGLHKKIGFIGLLVGLLVAVGVTARDVRTKTQTILPKPTAQQPLVVEQQPVAKQPSKQQPVEKKTAVNMAATQQPTKKKSSKKKLSLETIHGLALEQQSGLSSQTLSKDGSITRAVKVKPATQLKSDLFTQSQAHMSLPEIKSLIASTYNTKPYEKMIKEILDRENQYKEDYVFYHVADNSWRVPQDLYTRLYWHFKALPAELMKSFTFLRFEDVSGPSVVQSFLINKLKEGGLINDHELGSFLFATNIALFGNVGTQPECTWQYFVKSRGHMSPVRVVYEKIMDKFGLSHKYVDELMALIDLYKTNEQTIVQVFVPQDRVDEIGYLSWIKGIPAHKKTMDMVLRSVENKTFPKTAPAIVHYAESFKKEQEKNPIFKNLIQRVKAGDFSLSYFLKFYRNRPDEIEGINNFQARLVFTPELLLNPLSGVKIFRYCAATPEQMNNYQRKFDEIIKKIIAEKKQ